MRSLATALPLVVLAGCVAPSDSTETATTAVSVPVAVTLPMDPGQVSCSQVNASPAYGEALSGWVSGHARAAIVWGGSNRGGTVSAEQIRGYCAGNPHARAAGIAPNVIGILN